MHADRFVLDTGSGEIKMKTTVCRYRPPLIRHYSQEPGYILLFAHGVGLHKELWEPAIEYLFEQDKDNKGPNRILEAWAIDCPNHGQAASLNDTIFLNNLKIITIHDYAETFTSLYLSGLMGEIKKGAQKLVLIGHSLGANAVILATASFDPPSTMPFDMVILVEPPIFAQSMINKMTDMFWLVAKSTPHRRSIWSSKDEAYEWLKSRTPWKFWDHRVLKLYTEYGLRPLPTPSHPAEKGVVLSCSPAHEAADYDTLQPDTEQVVQHMNKLCGIIPFHAVYGARNDMFSREVQDSLHDPSSGRAIASVRRVKGAGHLIVQERPEGLANALYSIINNSQCPARL